MPTPVYILCSQSGSEDKLTGLLSVYNIVEQIEITKVPPVTAPPGAALVIRSTPLRFSAVWRKSEDDDPTYGYLHQMVLRFPGGREIEIASGELRFDAPMYRIIRNMDGYLPVEGPGILVVESRITLQNGTVLRQSYEIILKDVTVNSATQSQSTSTESPLLSEAG